ncbi:putative lipoprotein [Leptospira sp. P2653]|nr:putative lipoprotein [Leptospira sp. P2653]
MKQNGKKIIRGTLSIATFLTLFLFFLMSCGSKDSNKDLITNLALAQILAGSGEPQGKAEFRLSNTNKLLSARSSNVQQFKTLSTASCGFIGRQSSKLR